MLAVKASSWIINVVPVMALFLIWQTYDSTKPKIFWSSIIVVGYLFFAPVVSGALSFIVLLIHMFVAFTSERRKEAELRESFMSAELEAQFEKNRTA